jgi:hypothetical protein
MGDDGKGGKSDVCVSGIKLVDGSPGLSVDGEEFRVTLLLPFGCFAES